MNVYEIVTKKIIEKLEAGTIPWQKTWSGSNSVNWLTQKEYRGINRLLLDGGEYATFNQIKSKGGKVKKGEKGHIVVFWKWLEIEDEDSETGDVEIKNVPLLRYYKVFEINTQCEGLTSKKKLLEMFDNDPIGEAETVINEFEDKPDIISLSGSNRAYYTPATDTVTMPLLEQFIGSEQYYSTLFHELIHSTGIDKRLGRYKSMEVSAFGSTSYSKEELVAEIGAAMLCGIVGIQERVIDNQAAYINSWLQALRGDSKMIVIAAGQAQKAVDYILNNKEKEQ